MDVLLIYPHTSTSSIEEGVRVPPLGLAYIAAVLERNGFKAGILDMNAQPQTARIFPDILKKESPKIVGLTCLTPFHSTVLGLARTIKESIGAKVVVGGAHATALPEEMLAEKAIDCVVMGEGEETMVELADCFLNGEKSLEDVNGIVFIKDEKLVKTKPRGYIQNLDLLPFPARHLLPNEEYSAPQYKGKRITSLITSRGCPYICSFCDYHYLMGPRFRRRSVPNVVDEIEECIVKYNTNYISFRDSTFTFDEKWITSFCETIKQRGLSFSWDCNGRVNLVTEKMLHQMKAAGCTLISYGIESGEQSLLDTVNKKITVEQAISAVHMTKKAGIEVLSYFILGLPGENWQTIDKTIALASRLNSDYTQFSLSTPFPGTPLYNYAKANKLIRNVSWDDFSPINTAIMRTDELDYAELERALKMAYRKYYLRPKYILTRATKLRPGNIKRNLAGLKMFVQELSGK